MAPATQDLSAVFSGLQIEASNEPLPEPVRGGVASGPNPFTDTLQASVDNGTPYSFYVPPQAIKRAVFLINAAARKLNVGVRVVVNVKKDDKGQVTYIAEKKGTPNEGKVLIRFQGKKERKQQTAPRPYSIVKDKTDATGNTYIVRRRSDQAAVFKGSKDDAKKQYDTLTLEAKNTPETQEQPQATGQAPAAESPSGDAAA